MGILVEWFFLNIYFFRFYGDIVFYLFKFLYLYWIYVLVISFCNFYSELFKKEENINKD